ncbi:DUF3514 domain-containing protein [Ehrlichia ruminantium]|nr:DUF3514 domain-containing protein [Ehrlichia ruminantium]
MLLSKDKNKKKKDPNNQENDERNQAGESGVKPEVPNQQSMQDTGQGVVEGGTAAGDISDVRGMGIEVASSSSKPQPSSSLEDIYMRQGAKPKSRTQSKVAQQSTEQSQSIRSRGDLPPRFVKQTDVSLKKTNDGSSICGTERRSDQSTTQSQDIRLKRDLPPRFAKCVSDIFLTEQQHDNLGVHDTHGKELMHSFEELNVASPESGGDQNVLPDIIYEKYVLLQQKYSDIKQPSSSSCLARLRGMHTGYLNFLVKRLFTTQNNKLVMREEYLQMLSDITEHVEVAIILSKLNFMSQYLLVFGAYKASRLMLAQKLSTSDFYVIDNLLLELILVSYRERVNLYCAQREVVRIYAMINYNSSYNPSCSNIKFCKVVVQLFRDLLFARQNMVLDFLDLQLVNFLIISASIQIDVMNRCVYEYFNNRGYSTRCCKSEVLNLCNRICKGFSYMYNASPHAVSTGYSIPLPKVLLHMCSPEFCDEFSRLIQENHGKFHDLLNGIVDNISNSVKNEGFDNVYRILNICEEIICTMHDVCDDQQEQQEESQLNEEELYYSSDFDYGR